MTKGKRSTGNAGLPPGWELRGGILRIRKKWPARVIKARPELKGRDFTKSLSTSDLKAAERPAAVALAEYHRLCDEYSTPAPPTLPASAAEWIYSIPDGETSSALESHFHLAQIEVAKGYATQLQLPALVAALLPDDAKARVIAFIQAELDATARDDATKLRALAYPEELPDTGETAPLAPLTGDALLDAWHAETQAAPSTLKKYKATFKAIGNCLGFDDVRRITVDDAVKFKEARTAAGISIATIEDDIRGAGGVCRWAVKNRKLQSNPFDGIAPKAARQGTEPREPFTDEEAKTILSAARKQTGWLRCGSWVLCFTGARISEVAELKRSDVRNEAGTWFFDIKPTAQRQGKTKTFQRMLPLHPALIAEGFLAYVEALPDDANTPLFPDLTPDPKGGRTTPAGSKLSRWMKGTVKITDGTKAPAHSWRHRMEDELRTARVPEEVTDAITGRHNPRNAGAGYGKGFRRMPGEVLKELRKLPSPITS